MDRARHGARARLVSRRREDTKARRLRRDGPAQDPGTNMRLHGVQSRCARELDAMASIIGQWLLGLTGGPLMATTASPREPRPRALVDQETEDLVHARVVAVEPDAFLFVVRVRGFSDQPPVDQHKRERLEGIERFFGADRLRRGDHEDQVFDAMALAAVLWWPELVRQDHPAPELQQSPISISVPDPRAPTDNCQRHVQCRRPNREPACHGAVRASGESCAPLVFSGKTAVAIADIALRRTTVKQSNPCSLGSPTMTVRVMSVVPSSY